MINQNFKFPKQTCSLKYTIEIDRYHIDDKNQVFINPAWLDIQVKEMWDDPIFERIKEQIDINFIQIEGNRKKIMFPGYDLQSQMKFSLFLYLYEHKFSILLNENEISVDEVIPEMFEKYNPDHSGYYHEFEEYFPRFFISVFDSVLSEDITTTYQDNKDYCEDFINNTEDYPTVTVQDAPKNPEAYSGLRDIGILFEPNNFFSQIEIELEFLDNVIQETTVKVDDYILGILDTIAEKTIEEFKEENQDIENRQEKLEERFIENILKEKEIILDHHYSFPGRERPEEKTIFEEETEGKNDVENME
jgi:hypothetical protein